MPFVEHGQKRTYKIQNSNQCIQHYLSIKLPQSQISLLQLKPNYHFDMERLWRHHTKSHDNFEPPHHTIHRRYFKKNNIVFSQKKTPSTQLHNSSHPTANFANARVETLWNPISFDHLTTAFNPTRTINSTTIHIIR